MRATKFEFEQRFWIFGAIFWVGFSLQWLDPTNFAIGLLHSVRPSLDLNSPEGNLLLRLVFGAGAMLVFGAAALRTLATAYLKTEIVHDKSQHSEAVVADGPYRYMRNPLYFANMPLAAGFGVMASRAGWLFLVIAMGVFMYRLVVREEEDLLASQGESYRAYIRAVPRFWPSLTPRLPSSGGQPRWGQAFAGESLFWLFGVSALCFAVTLDFRLSGIVLVLSFPVYFLGVRFAKSRAA